MKRLFIVMARTHMDQCPCKVPQTETIGPEDQLLAVKHQSSRGRWAISGPFFGVINTGTTIVTFLMVFLIQNSQNRDSAAIQVKLDELIRVSKANNAFMGLEHLTDEELEEIKGKCEGRAKAVLEARKASEDAKHRLRLIDGDIQ